MALSGGHVAGAGDHVGDHNLVDAQLTNLANGLSATTANANLALSQIAALGGSTSASYATALAGSTYTVIKTTTWPARPSARTDLVFIWKGADPSPAIVTSGTGGMLDGVDSRFVTP